MEYSKLLEDLFTQVAESGASDLHLAVGRHPVLRISGQLIPLAKKPILTAEDTAGAVEFMLGKDVFKIFTEEREKDFAYSFKDKIRFRVNTYFQKGFIGVALRVVPVKIRTVTELNLPSIITEFAKKQQGFFLVVGPTGHGKSTTLAALIDIINHTRAEHIITIEDPIEYLFTPDRSIIDQREIGLDTKDFYRAIRSTLREDVNVVMVGEMRDLESI